MKQKYFPHWRPVPRFFILRATGLANIIDGCVIFFTGRSPSFGYNLAKWTAHQNQWRRFGS